MEKKYQKVPVKNPKKLNYTTQLKNDVQISSDRISWSYLIFIYNELKEKYKFEMQDFIFLIYLYELGLFRYHVDTGDFKKYSVLNLVKDGFVEKNEAAEKSLYKLSEKGLSFIKDFYYELDNYRKYVAKNRVVDLEIESRSENIIGSFEF